MAQPGTAFGIAALSLGLCLSAHAQAPQVEKNVSMRMAQAIIDGALEQCAKDGFKVTVAIVDNAGVLHSLVRGDGTAPHTVEVARRKAYTARTRGQTTLEFMKALENPAMAPLRQIPDTIALGGGVPIRAGGVVIGGVGVGGAPGGDKDEACANAGLARVADALK
jgi:uncharacterized protein GlcG (DUF336 family)